MTTLKLTRDVWKHAGWRSRARLLRSLLRLDLLALDGAKLGVYYVRLGVWHAQVTLAPALISALISAPLRYASSTRR